MEFIDQFTGITLANLKRSDIEARLNNLSISPSSMADMETAIVLSMALDARNGVTSGIIQNGGNISQKPLTDNTLTSYNVPTNEVWQYLAVEFHNTDGAAACTCELFVSDGPVDITLHSQVLPPASKVTVNIGTITTGDLFLTSNLLLKVKQSGESSLVNANFAYEIKQL